MEVEGPRVEGKGGKKEGAESIVLLIFVLWRCFNRRYMRRCGLGQKVLFLTYVFFRSGFKPTQ